MVKSTSAVCGVDLQGKRYFALSAENGADDYGEWLASSGQNDTVVTYSNIDYTPIGGEARELLPREGMENEITAG